MKLSYTVARAVGRVTLLVTTPVEPALRVQTGALLLRQEKDACQAAFVDLRGDMPRLATAGGSFDADAVMALAALAARAERPGDHRELAVAADGADAPVVCQVTPVRHCELVSMSVPLPERMEEVKLPLCGGGVALPVVFRPGVRYVIVPAGTVDRVAARQALGHWCEVLSAPAVELLFWNEGSAAFEAIRYEHLTALTRRPGGSAGGAGALAAWLTVRRGAGQILSLKQPGGAVAAVTGRQGRLTSLTVSAPVELTAEKTTRLLF